MGHLLLYTFPITTVTTLSPPPSQIETSKAAPSPKHTGFWTVFLSTFFTILLAEMGDKTQVTVLLMSAESGNPWVVFTGAAIALIATSLVGVLVGRWLSQKIAPRTLDILAGLLLLAITAGLIWDIVALG